MLLKEYEDIASEDQGSARSSESELLAQAIAAMEQSDQAPQDAVQRISAVHFVRQVWSFFVSDLASPDNAMPAELRASLVSIGIFIIKHLDRMRDDRSIKFEPVIEISRTIQKMTRSHLAVD